VSLSDLEGFEVADNGHEEGLDRKAEVQAAGRECVGLLRGLRTEELVAVKLYYLDGLTYSQAGAVLGKSKQRVQQIVRRALEQMRSTLVRKGGVACKTQ
jgi:RNA polymerase sigma factor (sigma-70 family)